MRLESNVYLGREESLIFLNLVKNCDYDAIRKRDAFLYAEDDTNQVTEIILSDEAEYQIDNGEEMLNYSNPLIQYGTYDREHKCAVLDSTFSSKMGIEWQIEKDECDKKISWDNSLDAGRTKSFEHLVDAA